MSSRRTLAASCATMCRGCHCGLDDVLSGRDRAALARPIGVEELAAGLVDALVGVGAEVVALGLQQVGGQALAAVAVVEGQRGGERRAPARPPSTACATTRRQEVWQRSITSGEVGVEQQVAEVRDRGRRLP